MIVSVAGGSAEWIESLNVKQWLNVKLHGEIQQSILRLDIHNDHTVKIINILEHKMDGVRLRVLDDYCSWANRMELRYLATDLLCNANDKFKLEKSFKAYLAEAKWEHKIIFYFPQMHYSLFKFLNSCIQLQFFVNVFCCIFLGKKCRRYSFLTLTLSVIVTILWNYLLQFVIIKCNYFMQY